MAGSANPRILERALTWHGQTRALHKPPKRSECDRRAQADTRQQAKREHTDTWHGPQAGTGSDSDTQRERRDRTRRRLSGSETHTLSNHEIRAQGWAGGREDVEGYQLVAVAGRSGWSKRLLFCRSTEQVNQ